MKLLAVNYHYIGSNRYPSSSIHEVSPEIFEKKLQILGQAFSFISLEDLVLAVKCKKNLPPQSCLISFDDGLRCQYELALPILDRLAIPAAFFVNGYYYKTGRALHIHKLHWCRAHIEPCNFMEYVAGYYKEFTGNDLNFSDLVPSDSELRRLYAYDDMRTAGIKYVLSKGVIQRDVEKSIIDKIFSNIESEEVFANKTFIGKEGIDILRNRGMLGCHGYDHDRRVFDNVSLYASDLEEWRKSVLNSEIPEDLVVSYPYGFPGQRFLSHLGTLSGALKIVAGFTMKRGFINSLEDPVALCRIDTNDAPAGKHPLFDVIGSEIKITDPTLMQ